MEGPAPPPPRPALDAEGLRAAVAARLSRAGRLQRVTLADVARHAAPGDAWIAVDGAVYDITEHVALVGGQNRTSELLAILRTLGTDCSAEFNGVHSERARRQLQPYMIGELVPDERAAAEAAAEPAAEAPP